MHGIRLAVASFSLFYLFLTARADEASTQTAEKESIESKYLSNIRQVTSGFTKAGEGYFSPDGKNIIFQAQPTEYMFYQIYTLPLADFKTRTPKMVSTGRGRTTCSYFAPDGKSILFASS